MTYRFEYLLPLPMKEIPTGNSDIWEVQSFTFQRGKSYLVEAPSGKGKTSLLSIMYGIRKDYSGNMFIDEREAGKIQLSYIFQGLELFDDLRAWDNIMLKNNITHHKTNQQISSMADRLNIGQFLKKKCGLLSYGQRQRVAIIRAMCQPFDFLFADECFSHIDRATGEVVMELVREECHYREAGLILTSLGNSQHQMDLTPSL